MIHLNLHGGRADGPVDPRGAAFAFAVVSECELELANDVDHGKVRLDSANPYSRANHLQERVLRRVLGAQAESITRAFQTRGVRQDSVTGAAGFTETDLVAFAAYEFDEVIAPQNWRDIGQVRQHIPLGMTSYEVLLDKSTGQAKVWHGGLKSVEMVGHQVDTYRRPVTYLCLGKQVDWITQMAMRASGRGVEQRLTRQLQLGHELAQNALAFEGGGAAGIDAWGLDNIPYLPRQVIATALSAMTAVQLYAAIAGQIRAVVSASLTVVGSRNSRSRPLRCALAPAILSRAHELTMPGSDVSVIRSLERDFGSERADLSPPVTFHEWQELDDFAGTADVHAMFLCPEQGPAEVDDIAVHIEWMEPIIVPGIQSGICTESYAISRTGGMMIPFPAGCRLVEFDA